MYANDVDIGSDVTISGKTTTGQLVIDGGTNADNYVSRSSSTAPLVIGNLNGAHLVLDYDEIQRKANATAAESLYLNYGGGNVYLSNGTQIYASNGTFITPTLRATNIGDNNNVVSTAFIATGNITTLNSNTISNAGAIVTRDMEVVDTLKSYKWDISHVANLANDFTVSPTLQLASGATIQFSAINTSTKVCTFTVTDSSSISSDSLGGVTWTQYSKVKFTINLNDVVNSNCDGYLTVKMNSTAGTLVISGTLDDVTGLATGTNYNAEGATIMLYEVGAGSQSTTYPVGIRMTAYGSNKRSYIDIYGGTSTSSWSTPHVRIGNVGGLTFNGKTLENQWGIYTDRGYFSGAIVSKEGNIGGFTIDQTKLFNGTNSLTSTATGVYLGTDGIRNYNTTGSKHVTIKDGTITANSVDLTGKITATSGSISGSLVSSGIDASNITAGTLSADRIGAGSITIGKINQKVYAYSNNGQGTGYAKLFTISHTDSYRNAPISFLFHNRGKRETRVSLNYINNQTPASAVIQNATYDGDTAFYYVSKGNAVYDVYFALAESWDDTYVTDYINQYSSGLEVEWSGSYYGTSLPSGAVEFTKLVGSIAKSTIDDYAKTATTYITDIDSNKGITIKPSNSSGNDYLQINSSAISFYRNNVETVKLEDSAFRIGKLGTNMRNVYVTDSAVQIRNNTTPLAEYGSDIKFYDGTGNATTNIAAQIGSTGISIKKGDINLGNGTFTVSSTGNITAKDGSIGGWTISSSSIYSSDTSTIKSIVAGTRTASSTGDGIYIGSNGVLNVGKASGNYLTFDGTNLDLKTDWLRFDNEDKSVIVGENENSSLLIKENTIRMLNPDRFEIFSANMDGALQNIYGSSYPVRQLFNNCNGVQCTAEGHMDYNFVIANGATIKTSFSAVLYENGNYSGTEADNSISFTKGTAQTINVTGGKSGIVYTIEYDGNITFCITCTPNIDKLSISLDTWVSFYTSSPSYTLGTRKEGARGAFSTTLGERLVASGEHQTVIGVNNTEDADKLFIIGNGGNVLTVSKSGKLNCYNHQSGVVSTGIQNATYGGVTTSCRYRRWDDDFVEVWTTTSITPRAVNTATTKTIGIPFPNFLTKASYHGFVSIQGIPEIATCHVGLTPHAPSGDNYRYDAVTINIYASNTTTRYVNVYYCGTLTSNI